MVKWMNRIMDKIYVQRLVNRLLKMAMRQCSIKRTKNSATKMRIMRCGSVRMYSLGASWLALDLPLTIDTHMYEMVQ